MIAAIWILAAAIIGFIVGYLVRGYWRFHKPGSQHFYTFKPQQDEFLRWDGHDFVSLSPREYVLAGSNPIVASRSRTRAEGVRYETRRVE